MKLFSPHVFERNASIYRLMAHPKRLAILNLLKGEGECSVEKITKRLRLPKANVSQHLALLRHARLVRMRRSGVNIFYRISDPRIVEPCRIMKELWEGKVLDRP